jgi:hypothetical protein
MATISGMSCVSTSGTVSPGDFGLGTALIGVDAANSHLGFRIILFSSLFLSTGPAMLNSAIRGSCVPVIQASKATGLDQGENQGLDSCVIPDQGTGMISPAGRNGFLAQMRAGADAGRCLRKLPGGRKGNGGPIGADPLSTPSPPDRLPVCAVDAGVPDSSRSSHDSLVPSCMKHTTSACHASVQHRQPFPNRSIPFHSRVVAVHISSDTGPYATPCPSASRSSKRTPRFLRPTLATRATLASSSTCSPVPSPRNPWNPSSPSPATTWFTTPAQPTRR